MIALLLFAQAATTADASSVPWAEIVTAVGVVIAAAFGLVAALASLKNQREAREDRAAQAERDLRVQETAEHNKLMLASLEAITRNVDDAVNHRHGGEPRLLDMVRAGLRQSERNADAIDRVRIDVADVRRDLIDHVAWETGQKYQTPAQIDARIAEAITETSRAVRTRAPIPQFPHEGDTP